MFSDRKIWLRQHSKPSSSSYFRVPFVFTSGEPNPARTVFDGFIWRRQEVRTPKKSCPDSSSSSIGGVRGDGTMCWCQSCVYTQDTTSRRPTIDPITSTTQVNNKHSSSRRKTVRGVIQMDCEFDKCSDAGGGIHQSRQQCAARLLFSQECGLQDILLIIR